MKTFLLYVLLLSLLIIGGGCLAQRSTYGSRVTMVQTSPEAVSWVPLPVSTSTVTPMPTPTPTPTSVFPAASAFNILMTFTGQGGMTTDPFFVPASYWELWYTADPFATGGQDSVSASGSNSALFPALRIQIIDVTNSGDVIETIEPPGGLDKNLWARSGSDPRPWRQKIYGGNKDYRLEITARHLKSYTIEVRTPRQG